MAEPSRETRQFTEREGAPELTDLTGASTVLGLADLVAEWERRHDEACNPFGPPDMTTPEGETDADWLENRQIDGSVVAPPLVGGLLAHAGGEADVGPGSAIGAGELDDDRLRQQRMTASRQDIGRCDLCGSEEGWRSLLTIDGVPAWCCATCTERVQAPSDPPNVVPPPERES